MYAAYVRETGHVARPDDSGFGAVEIVGAMVLISAAVLMIGLAIFARADSNERFEMSRSTRRAAVNAIGLAETANCAGWGLWWADSPSAPPPLALHQTPDCAPPEDEGWVSDSPLDNHAAVIGIHWTVLEREWSPVVVGFSDYYQMGGREDCNTNAIPRPVRRVVTASRYGGLPAGAAPDGDGMWDAADGAVIAASIAAEPDKWEIAVLYAEGPPLPATAGWVVWKNAPSDGDWNHHWDEANTWKPALTDMASRSVFTEPRNVAYTHPAHSGFTSPYSPPNAIPIELEIQVQGRRNPLNVSCWVVAVPAGCLGTQAGTTADSKTEWTWRKVSAGESTDIAASLSNTDKAEVETVCGDSSANGAEGIAGNSARVSLPTRAAAANRADSRAGQSLLADDPPENQRPLRPAAAFVHR